MRFSSEALRLEREHGLTIVEWPQSETRMTICSERLHGLVVEQRLRHPGVAERDDRILTAFADAVAKFQPDHILIALRSSEHANWQERGLIGHVKERFGLPLTTFALDPQGHVPTAPGPDRDSA